MEEDSSDLREALASMLDAQKLCSSSIIRETGSREPQLGLGFIICMIWTPPCADLESPRTGQCAVLEGSLEAESTGSRSRHFSGFGVPEMVL